MLNLKRIINAPIRLLIIAFSLFLMCDSSIAFFKRPHWLIFFPKETNFWSEMSRNFSISSDLSNPYIQKQIRWYQQHPGHLKRILKNSEPFIHYVYEQTRRQSLPAELALIPLLESQYNPAIGARSGAAGLWQMMPGTATKFGLKVNRSYDGRRDVMASTKAALTYLAYLYHHFNQDWLLALAAYQAGEGKIQAITARRGRNFWDLPFTKSNISKLLAIASIIKQPHLYHLTLPPMAQKSSAQELAWEEADVMNLSETAKPLKSDNHLASNKLKINNSSPSYLRKSRKNAKASSSQSSSTKTYTIKKGDRLDTIAKRFHTTVKSLRNANHIKNDKRLRVGHPVVIP
jgi:membrane-bound lytic murein transglycosylase D